MTYIPTKETRQKIRATLKRRIASGEITTLGKKTKELWENPEYRRNQIEKHKNYKFTEEHRRNISLSQKGKIGYWKGKEYPLEARKKISNSMKGKNSKNNNPMWKGGIYPETRLQRDLFKKTIQNQVLERDNYTCQLCGEKGGDLRVDHIQSWAEYVELRFNMDNCRTLCVPCHYEITYSRSMPSNVKKWGHN